MVFLLQFFEKARDKLAQFGRATLEVGDQQVGEHVLGGSQTNGQSLFWGELVDEIDELEQTGLEL